MPVRAAHRTTICRWQWCSSPARSPSWLAVTVKRLHDIDKSGWWALLLVVPIAGAIALFVMNGFIAGTPHANRFGEPPSVDEATPAPRDPA
ncbi:DUF805 domain-containing protein [Burkholderia seminalis]|uniref:DUF805 domain-containing protein n=1 Tax=Burkholderia seminalis TaxID=488731 RepID=UPI0031D72671